MVFHDQEGTALNKAYSVLCVADYNLLYQSLDYAFDLEITSSQSKFIKNLAGVAPTPAFSYLLELHLKNKSLTKNLTWKKRLISTLIWELWLDEKGHFVFYNPHQTLIRQVVIAPGFEQGIIFGDFSEKKIPLTQDLEIVLFSNWLANYGDVILHASGIARQNKGYIFVGDSRVGKSTLASYLSTDQVNTVLGEDQIILRYIDGKFWVYGTPWHEDPRMCAARGVPLEKIFFLSREGEDGAQELSPSNSIVKLMTTAFVPYYRPDTVERILDRFKVLTDTFPLFLLKYKLGTKVENLIYA